MAYLLSIDQGTTSSRAILFDEHGKRIATAQQEFPQYYPQDGWVEHNPEEIWSSTLDVCKQIVNTEQDITAIGITNQRETTIIWDKATGKPIYNAIVWQDRRTAELCQTLKQHEDKITQKTGLLLDPYFSATKIAWLLDHVPDARKKAEQGQLAFGTVDSFLLWRLTGGAIHATDATNASRTMLYNIHDHRWDNELLTLFNIPEKILPRVMNSADDFGTTDLNTIGKSIPICAIAGDQQAASIGQACFTKGMMKSTYGTGCFVMVNTGDTAIRSKKRLLTTIAYQIDNKVRYALEGSIFNAGTAIKWLRDNMKLIQDSNETEALAQGLPDNQGVYFVPAFTGLGAPYWQPDARGAIFGLTRDTGTAELVRAALESICYQTYDLIESFIEDGITPTQIRVDGGMAKNTWLLQWLSNLLAIPVERPTITETTALGVAYLAGLQSGIYHSLEDIADHWTLDTSFFPDMSEEIRNTLLTKWRNAIEKVCSL